ncbi:MAG: carbohydrate ABC transporter permease, partial [Promethearchaeota archaeon]
IDQEPVLWFKNTPSLSSLADRWKIVGLLTSIIFGMLLLTVILVGIQKNLQIKADKAKLRISKEEDTRPLIERVLSLAPFYLILAVYLLFTLAPVFITILVSISTSFGIDQGDYATKPIESFVLNYSSVLFARSVAEPAFTSAFINSLILGLGTAGLGIGISLTGGYALARFKFRGNKLATFVILSTQMFPGLILLIPQYLIWKELNLLNRDPFTFKLADFSIETEISVVIIGVLIAYASGSVAYCTWMLKGYFETIPEEMEEAALIDGCDWFGAFWRIAVPLAKPGMVAVALFTFITAWNEFILARTFIREGEPQATLPLLLYNYQDLGAPDVPVYFALLAPYAILIATPIVIMFMLLQKQLAAGATAGGIK